MPCTFRATRASFTTELDNINFYTLHLFLAYAEANPALIVWYPL